MYNEERKEEFISDYMRSRVVSKTTLTGLFNKTEAIEERKQKDICEFTTEEILDLYRNYGSRSAATLENVSIHLKNYTRFMQYKGVCASNNYEGLTKEIISGCIDPEIMKKKYLSRQEINDIEDQLLNAQDKAICELLFRGVSGRNMEDIITITKDSMSADQSEIMLKSGRILALDERLKRYLLECFDEEEVVSYGSTCRIRKVQGKGRLYKAAENAQQNEIVEGDRAFRYVYRKIMLWRNYLSLPILTMQTLQTSGLKHEIEKNLKKTKLSLREFLRTTKGIEIAKAYGYEGKSMVDIVAAKMKDLL